MPAVGSHSTRENLSAGVGGRAADGHPEQDPTARALTRARTGG